MTRRLGRALFAAITVPALLAACAGSPDRGAAGPPIPDRPAAAAEILWDEWGVPHVYADEEEALFHAFGWAQAQAHGDLLLRLYGESRGRGAEYWGAGHLPADRRIRTLGIPELAATWYAAQRPGPRAWLDAFAAGINAYLAAHPEAVGDAVRAVLPVTGTDVLGQTLNVVHFTFAPAPWDAAGRVAPAAGSNGWAIGPARSAGGHAMLLANPHLPWSGLFTWFEAHLVGPGIDASGAALVGMPFLGVAFNDRLGWTHTVNVVDVADLYELELVEGGYRWDGGVRAFETRLDTLRARGADGSVSTEVLTLRRSVHGPVVEERDGRAYALRVAGLDRPHLFEQYMDMARASSLAEFEAALSRLQNPFFNVVYADADGHVLYVFNGAVPARPRGDWGFWTGTVPGDDPALLWTDVHDYGDLPRVLDPPAGWVQNANDPPWTATWPPALDAADFPTYMSPPSVSFRPQRSIEMLLADSTISFDELAAYKHSTRVGLADRLLDDLIPAARESGDGLARRAADALAAWDRTTDADSRGAVLFYAFVGELAERYDGLASAFATAWSPTAPLTTPDGLADPAAAAAELADAARRIESTFGALDVPWGEAFRLRRDTLDLAANGIGDPFGAFRVAWYEREDDGRFTATGGDSYVAAVEFGEPVRARGLLGYGNWSRPGSPHRTDQLPLFSEQRLRPIWRARADVEAHLERREVVPGEGASGRRDASGASASGPR